MYLIDSLFILNTKVIHENVMSMEELRDMIVGDEAPSAISDKIKDLLYTRSAEKIEALRPSVSNSMFDAALDAE